MWTFTPIYKCSIWGGSRLPAYKNDRSANVPVGSIGESWEISDVEGNVSVVASGPDAGANLNQLINLYGSSLLGKKNLQNYGKRFPLLIKIIDAAADLSIQVHPDDVMAHNMGHPFGKNEMWVVLDAKPGAKLANGFKHPVPHDSLKQLVDSGSIINTLRFTEVKSGDAFFIPAGRVHAIGKGILTAEIQQTSDDTFRIYDYNRTDNDGNRRQLHVNMAAKALNFNDTNGFPVKYPDTPDANILTTSFFTVNMLRLSETVSRDYSGIDSFVIIMAIGGKAILQTHNDTVTLEKGNTVLLPAEDSVLNIEPLDNTEFKALEIYI